MALAGLHVSCSFVGGRVSGGALGALPIPGRAYWSETMDSPGTTAGSAPSASTEQGTPIMTVSVAVDSYVSIGKNPDVIAAINGRRHLVRAGVDRDFACDGGDRLAWTQA